MKIIKLKDNPDKDGWYPIPENLINRDMFMYPNLGEDDKWGTKERDNRKVNAITSYMGEYFEKLNLKWYIGAMGYDNMVIFDENNKEYECYYRFFIFNGSKFIFMFEDDGDKEYRKYWNNKIVFDRMEKIDKIINK